MLSSTIKLLPLTFNHPYKFLSYIHFFTSAHNISFNSFAGHTFAPEILNGLQEGPQTAHRIIQQQKTTLQQLQEMDPDQNRNRIFTCQAKIISLSFYKTWFYYGCPICTASFCANNKTKYPKHGRPAAGPIPWFKFACLVEDETE